MLSPVRWEAFRADPVDILKSFDKVDDVVDLDVLGVEGDHEASEQRIDLGPVHGRELFEVPLHMAGQLLAVGAMHPLHLDVSTLRPNPDVPAPPA